MQICSLQSLTTDCLPLHVAHQTIASAAAMQVRPPSIASHARIIVKQVLMSEMTELMFANESAVHADELRRKEMRAS